jgi:hypothetical protein
MSNPEVIQRYGFLAYRPNEGDILPITNGPGIVIVACAADKERLVDEYTILEVYEAHNNVLEIAGRVLALDWSAQCEGHRFAFIASIADPEQRYMCMRECSYECRV